MYVLWRNLLLAMASLSLLAGCSKNLRETTFSNPDARYRLAIAGDSSEFKDRIRQKLIENYQSICRIDVVNLGKLEQIDVDDYDAVLIMDTCMAWGGFNRDATGYINANPQTKKIILFLSAGDPDWEYTYKGVDAITSASLPDKTDMVVDELTEKIDQVLTSGQQ